MFTFIPSIYGFHTIDYGFYTRLKKIQPKKIISGEKLEKMTEILNWYIFPHFIPARPETGSFTAIYFAVLQDPIYIFIYSNLNPFSLKSIRQVSTTSGS